MKYQLIWQPHAIEKLAEVYLAGKVHSLSKAITKSMHEVERKLAVNPLVWGESRDGRDRIMFEPPLTVEYEVFEESHFIIIFDLRLNLPKA
jgi:hypothetical protein